MGRKIEMKRIEDLTKCQVTYSKRRSSMMKKMNELAVCCDADVAFVAFSPSGRISKFSGEKRIEDVLFRYINIPAEKKFNHINDVQGKLEKLRNLTDHINGENSKLHYLDKQIENLELQIKKSGLELQILEAGLRDYEIDAEESPPLYQLSWCERNLKQSLEKVIARKNALCGNFPGQFNFQMDQTELVGQLEIPFSSLSTKERLDLIGGGFSIGKILRQEDPWINPNNARVGTMQDSLHQIESMTNVDRPSNNVPTLMNTQAFSTPFSPLSNDFRTLLFSDAHFLPLPMPFEQSMMVNQTSSNVTDQTSVEALDNISLVNFSSDIYLSTQSLYNTLDPRLTFTMMPTAPEVGNINKPQFLDWSQSSEVVGHETNQLLHMDIKNGFSNVSTRYGNVDVEEDYRMDIHEIYEGNLPEYAMFHENLLLEDAFGDNIIWPSKMQKSNLSKWEDLDLENFNFQDSL